MSSSTAKGFPYPLSTDPVDVPSDIYNLANTIDTKTTTTATANTIVYRETSGKITIGDPTSSTHGATKNYVDSQIALAAPMTTKGDIVYLSANGTAVAHAARLGIGSNGYVLTVSNGLPVWQNPSSQPGGGTGTGYTQTSGTIGQDTAVTIDTIALSSFIGGEYKLSLKQGTKARRSSISIATEGSDVGYSEYAITTVGDLISGIDVSFVKSGSNGLLQVTITDASTTSATWRLSKLVQ